MSNINPIGGPSNLGKIVNKTISPPSTSQIDKPAPSKTDRLELSGVSHLMTTLKSNDIRTDKVAAIKAQIEAGTYESDDKLDSAIDKMIDDL